MAKPIQPNALSRGMKAAAAMALVAMAFAGLASCGGGGGGGGSADGGDQIIITSVRTDVPDLKIFSFDIKSVTDNDPLFRRLGRIGAREFQTFTGVQFKFSDIFVRNVALDECPTPGDAARSTCVAGDEFQKRVSPVTTLRYERSTDVAFSMFDTLSLDPITDIERVQPSQISVLSKESGPITAPSTAGVYYYRVCVVPVSTEVNTANNCSSARKVTVRPSGPDLVLENPSVPTSSKNSFTLSVTVKNTGNQNSLATTLTWYRSTDLTISTEDSSEGTDAVGILTSVAPGNTESDSIGINVRPESNTPYHYGACIGSVSGESDTSNNCIWIVTVLKDRIGRERVRYHTNNTDWGFF